MLIEEAIKILLAEDAGLAARVGTRIYPAFLPQTCEFPAIAWRGGKWKPDYVLAGGQPDEKKVTAEFTFACVADSYIDAARAFAALFSLLDGLACIVSDDATVPDTLTIQGIFIDPDKREEFYVDSTKKHHVRSVWHVVFVHQRT